MSRQGFIKVAARSTIGRHTKSVAASLLRFRLLTSCKGFLEVRDQSPTSQSIADLSLICRRSILYTLAVESSATSLRLTGDQSATGR